jgi:hypothetical protein
MRVTNMLPDIQYQMQQSQQALATATQQVSTGLRVNQPPMIPQPRPIWCFARGFGKRRSIYEQCQLCAPADADGGLGHQLRS